MKFNKSKIRGNGLFLIDYGDERYELVYKFGDSICDYPDMHVTEPLEDSDVLTAKGWIQLEKYKKEVKNV